jgi:molybdenum cofactor guanylyltransferase
MSDPAPIAFGFVLAGGQSSRMGRDKALIEFAGRPLIAHALSILREAGLNPAIAGLGAELKSELSSIAPIIDDRESGRGPLAGVCAALASTSARRAVFLSIDMPLLPASLLAYLLHHASVTESAVTVASVNGRAQTSRQFWTAAFCRFSKRSLRPAGWAVLRHLKPRPPV